MRAVARVRAPILYGLARAHITTTQSMPLARAPHASAAAWLPGGHADHAALALLGVERGEPVRDAARLERARVLEQLGLERRRRRASCAAVERAACAARAPRIVLGGARARRRG